MLNILRITLKRTALNAILFKTKYNYRFDYYKQAFRKYFEFKQVISP